MNTINVKTILTNEWPLYELLESVDIAGIHVPCGFISDGASVPRIFWSLFPPVGKYFLAAVVHDYVLAHRSIKWKEATRIFDEALKEVDVLSWKRKAMVLAVAFYGLIKRYD